MTTFQLFGRLHPLVVHFPIALIVLAAAVEAARCFRPDPSLARLTVLLLALGAIGALAAAGTGWIFAYESRPEPALRATLEWHRWLGIATAALSIVAWAAARRWANDSRPALRWLRRCTVWLTAVLLIVAAHLGALIVWGADYFS